MQEFPIDYLALLVATIVKLALGALWYSPIAFGPAWVASSGCSAAEMKARLPKAMAADFVATFIMAFILVHAVHYAGATGAAQGAAVGFFNWLGFIAATGFVAVAYGSRPWKLFLIDSAYLLVALIIMGAIVTIWP